ncbi:MAG TPA: DUF4091 domain-containing protein, partial [Armatimonadota bacterium]|nr:DUF4091 domain-containing protein [Armatimonadota bacterium]
MCVGTSVLCIVAVLALAATASAAGADVWVVDPLAKVFRDTEMPDEALAEIVMKAARGEYESAQICVRSAEAITGLDVVVGELNGDAGTIPASAISWNPVGYVPVTWNTYHTPDDELIRKAPFDCPDPLLPAELTDVAGGQTQPIWLTLRAPRAADAGEYAGEVTVRWDGGDISLSLQLTVWPFEIPEERHLTFTNWVNASNLAKHHDVEMNSDAFYDLLGKYAAMVAEHHQNVLWVSLGTIGISENAVGELGFDFTHFDRWVETCVANGCGRMIEIQPLGHWKDGWESTEIEFHGYGVTTADGERKDISAPACLPKLLPALEAHLRERGWIDIATIHIADEPAVHHVTSWREKSDWVRSLAPGIRRLDAIEAPDFGDSLEVWVPKLNHLYNWLDGYKRAQDAGAEMWFYTCCHPTASYPNRFLDFPLIETRVLQWYNWRYSLTGYLHWGLNFWTDDPINSAGNENLPPGDCWIVYPGEDGPLSSIRFEALRDGFEDFEYLWVLAERNREMAERLGADAALYDPEQRSDEYAHRIVRTMVDHEGDPSRLRALRDELAGEISRASALPRALIATNPPTSHRAAGYPHVVATRVWAEEGAEVNVNGGGAHLQPDGHWAHHTYMNG